MKFFLCCAYLFAVGTLSFLLGRLFPQQWLNPEKGLFRCFPFEKEGRLYEKLNIRKWHKRLPDMSRILPSVMPAKRLRSTYREDLPVMIRETCVAELVHIGGSLAGFGCLWLWSGIGGAVVSVLFALGNIPFILIQRYNRPRLLRLQKKCKAKQTL